MRNSFYSWVFLAAAFVMIFATAYCLHRIYVGWAVVSLIGAVAFMIAGLIARINHY